MSDTEEIEAAIDAAEAKERDAAETAELEKLGAEARETFPKDWKLRLYRLDGDAVSVSIEFIVATKPTAAEALRAAIDDYRTALAADPATAKEKGLTGRIVGLDGRPLA